MSEVAETADFDTEFDAAREADLQDETGVDAEATEETEEPAEDAETEEAAEPAPKAEEADKLTKAVKNLDRALKAERREKREMADKVAQLEARINAPAKTDSPEAMPDPNEDPIGWMRAAQKLIDTMQAQERQQTERSQQQTASQREFQRLNDAVGEAEADFKDEHPDYDDATKHLKQSIRDELEELGLADAELDAEFQKRVLGIATRAIQAGKNPAEVAYNLAKKRGFGVDKAATKLQTIAKGQSSARSMPAGGRPSGHLPVAEGVKLKGAAFDSWFAAESKRQRAAG